MNEKKRRLAVFAALPVVLIWAWYNLSDSPEPETGDPTTTVATIRPLLPVASSPQEPDRRLIDIEEKESEPWGRDPFRTYRYKTNSTGRRAYQPSWTLAGIIYNAVNPMAYVNNTRVRVGDKVDKATVIAIDRRTVTLDHKGKQIVLTVKKG